MKVRHPAVAGQFYPADAERLRRMVSQLMRDAGRGSIVPRAVIAPHAGYAYSGPIAASAYSHVAAGVEGIRRVALIGPSHRVPVRGLAASSAQAFATPLGRVAVDGDSVERLLDLPQVHLNDEAHSPEHGLEVHLPFLQLALDSFRLVPLVVGDAKPEEVAEALQPFADDPSALIVVSSDLSHYQPYHVARQLDRETADRIETLRDLSAGQACGRYAINGLLCLARRQGWRAQTVDLRNSGDTAGSRHQVVGYGACLFV